MADTPCPHCGELHAASEPFCPKTGVAIPAASTAAPGPPDKGVADILTEAWSLYRKNARMLIITCAVLFVPASIVKSCVVSAILGPTLVATTAVEAAAAERATDLEAARAALREAQARHADEQTIVKLQEQQADLSRRAMLAAGAAMGGFTILVLNLLGGLVTFFIYAVSVPLTNGALAIASADRLLGGTADWREVWALLLRRVGPLLTAIIPAAFITAFGFVVLYVPGLILALLFSFVSPVVLFEGLRGRAALRRSVELVTSDWLRVAIMVIVLGVLGWFAQLVASMVVPHGALFVGSLLGDLVLLVFLPLPVLGMVLLYFDVRRKREGFTDERLRAALEAFKAS